MMKSSLVSKFFPTPPFLIQPTPAPFPLSRSSRVSVAILSAVLAGLPMCSSAAISEEIHDSVRLSSWLNQRLDKPDVSQPLYLPGLVWIDPEEQTSQSKAKSDLLARIQQHELSPKVPESARASLQNFVEQLPVTGRVVLDKTDPHWLEVHPDKDPILRSGQRILLSDRPDTVTIVYGDGRTCQIKHDASLYARDYVRACEDVGGDPSQAWLVQPDGIVQRRGIALWDTDNQDTPAPGAWILVEEPRYPWHPSIYDQLARLLATQGPSAEHTNQIVRPVPVRSGGFVSSLLTGNDPKNLVVTGGDWGSVGLMQTPTARMAPAGEGSVSLTRASPYTRLNFNLQPLDWLETTFRYMDVSNRLYGPTIAGNQSYKDKSIDVKFRLNHESEYIPQVALGIRDLSGTGLFSGEYVVANKRTGNFDWSLGMGWGYLGARGNINNPFSIFSKSFDTRTTPTTAVANSGKISFKNWFHGPAAIFGGVQYQTPLDDLILKLEYDGNDYQHEPQNNNQSQKSAINIGAVYRYSDNIDLDIGLERGNTILLGANFHGRLDKLSTPKVGDPPMVPVLPSYPTHEPAWPEVAAQLEATTGWRVNQIRRSGGEMIVRFDKIDAYYWNAYIDRIAAILHRDVSAQTQYFRIQGVDHDLHVNEYIIDRSAWVDAKTRYLTPHEHRISVVSNQYQSGFFDPFDETVFDKPIKRFESDLGPYLNQSLGGPNGFILYQAGAELAGTWRFQPDTWLTGVLHGRVLDNYSNFTYDAPSNLPRVRTYIREYLTTSKVTMPVFQLTHVGRLGQDQYYSVYGGMLESMFGGVGGEWLYRPYDSSLAVGVDINAVKQRGFSQDFSFCDKKLYTGCVGTTMTGHASLYWDTGISDILATLQVGRYLAGDVGATLDLSRQFSNGVQMGAWATKTNVSAAQFGEGSFDKGIYVKIPFDAMMTVSSSSIANLVWQPLTRDGGARLNRAFRLFDLTKNASGDSLRWGPYDDSRKTQFGDVGDHTGDPLVEKSAFDATWDDLSLLGKGMGYSNFWQGVLLAGGITAASSILDRPADHLAVKYGQKKVARFGEKLGNLIPFVAAGVSGVMMLKDDDPVQTRAGMASIEASGVGVIAALGLKYAVGRDRPSTGQGAASFNVLSSSNSNTSFPSVHSTVAWAAITPYAKAYNAPWLYGVAALTSAARIGERKHWLSDTVAGALIGYGLGSLFWESRNQDKSSPSIYVSPGEVGLEWKTP